MQKRGFSLIKYLIVVVIVVILAIFVAAIFERDAINRSKDNTKMTQSGQIQSALETYFKDKNVYPPTLGVLQNTKPPLLAKNMDLKPFTYTPANKSATYILSFALLDQSDHGDHVTGTSPNKIYELTNEH